MLSNLHHLLKRSAELRPSSPAITYKDTTLSYSHLWRQVTGVAFGLSKLDLLLDDRVAIYLEKRTETVSGFFGVSLFGGVLVPVNPQLRAKQAAYILRDCQVRTLITSVERLQTLETELKSCPALEHVVLVSPATKVEHENDTSTYAIHHWSELFSPCETEYADTGRIDVDMAAILYTSGSTGMPKGVVLSHRNLLAGAESVAHYLKNSENDVILAVLPLSFDAGFSQLTTAFCVGAHAILMNYLLPSDVPRLCAKHQVTGLTCVPPLWVQIVDQPWPKEAALALRYFASTGGRMPKATFRKLRENFPHSTPFLMYGLTESFRSTYLDPAQVDLRPDSIGKAIPNSEVLVLRPDGSRCDPGEEGELVHRGALVAMGYWNDPVRTAERFRPLPGYAGENWGRSEMAVFSGDTVVADEEGFFYFIGRADEMIKTSGYRVSPTEIEEAAYETGLVREAVALGVEDSELGQRLVLFASPKNGVPFDGDVLLKAMRRELPLYMVPSTIIVRDPIPRSPNGKFDRALLDSEIRE